MNSIRQDSHNRGQGNGPFDKLGIVREITAKQRRRIYAYVRYLDILNQRTAKADVALIISQALPKEVETFALIEGVWVAQTRYRLLGSLASFRDTGEPKAFDLTVDILLALIGQNDA